MEFRLKCCMDVKFPEVDNYTENILVSREHNLEY